MQYASGPCGMLLKKNQFVGHLNVKNDQNQICVVYGVILHVLLARLHHTRASISCGTAGHPNRLMFSFYKCGCAIIFPYLSKNEMVAIIICKNRDRPE